MEMVEDHSVGLGGFLVENPLDEPGIDAGNAKGKEPRKGMPEQASALEGAEEKEEQKDGR